MFFNYFFLPHHSFNLKYWHDAVFTERYLGEWEAYCQHFFL